MFARFRLSPTAGTAATGEVIGGEVEDYLVTIAGKPGGGPGKPDSDADAALAAAEDEAILPLSEEEGTGASGTRDLPPTDDEAILPPTDDEAILPPTDDEATLPPTDDEAILPPTDDEATLPPTEEEPTE